MIGRPQRRDPRRGRRPPRCLPLVWLLLCVLAVGAPWGLGGASGGPALAAEVRNPDGVAVIVGNRDYAEVGDVAYARRDAEAFHRYVVDVLGFDPRNVRLVTDANFGKMRSLFGTEGRPGILSRFVEKRRELSGGRNVSDVVVFYSGHGLPSLNPNEAGSYLVAVDANPNDPAHNGYSVEELYRVLGALPARSVSVFLDACFSGVGGDGTPLLRASPAAVTQLPENVSENTVVFAAAEGQQIAFWDDEAGHGLFTHHLMDALYGGGDEDNDGRVTAGEVHRYLSEHVWYAALDTHGREQDAVLIDGTGTGARVLSATLADGTFPLRPRLDAPGVVADNYGADETRAAVDHKAVELSLGLERSEKALVQHGLASAGFSPGKIDGLIGKSTREALSAWQAAQGHEATGYLTADHAKTLMPAGESAQREQADRERRERENAPEPKTSITVRTVPPDAQVRVFTSAGSTYRDGMVVQPGHYELLVEARQHEAFRKVLPVEGATTYQISLCRLESQVQAVCENKNVTKTKWIEKKDDVTIDSFAYADMEDFGVDVEWYIDMSTSEQRELKDKLCRAVENKVLDELEDACERIYEGRIDHGSFKIMKKDCSDMSAGADAIIVCVGALDEYPEEYVEAVKDCRDETRQVRVCPDQIVTRLQ